MNFIRTALLSSAFFSTCCGITSAAPFSYNELIDGDLAGFNGPVFEFSAGINTVEGSVSVKGINTTGGLVLDGDRFDIEVPSGSLLLSARLDVLDTAFGAANGSASTALPALAFTLDDGFPGPNDFVRLVLRDGIDLSPTGRTYIRADAGDEFLFNESLPVGQGIYKVQVNTGSSGFTGDNIDSSFGYRWSFEVQAVPEPTSCLLSITAFGLLAASRSKRKTTKSLS